MPLEGGIHNAIELAQLGGIPTDQMGSELGNPYPGPSGESGEIRRTERTNLTITHDPLIGLDPDDRAVKN